MMSGRKGVSGREARVPYQHRHDRLSRFDATVTLSLDRGIVESPCRTVDRLSIEFYCSCFRYSRGESPLALRNCRLK